MPFEYSEETMFGRFYNKNVSWMTWSGEARSLAILKSRFPLYYQEDNTVNYELLKLNIHTPKASDLFKYLFHIPYQTLKNIDIDAIKTIEQQFGDHIIAHGIAEMKGGMYNLLLMCVSNQIRAPYEHWGAFVYGPSDISPVPHGPYYLIHSMPSLPQDVPNNPALSDVACILVPFPENKIILEDRLDQMITRGLTTAEQKVMFLDKIRTYDELLSELNAHQELKSQVAGKRILQDASHSVLFKEAKPNDDKDEHLQNLFT